MTASKYILAIDQGTSSTKSLIFDDKGNPVARGAESLKTEYLQNGFVEQDPESIYHNVLASVKKCLDEFTAGGFDKKDIAYIGISNQRETFLCWDEMGIPLHKAVVWQCKRSVDICRELQAGNTGQLVSSKTGLVIDPYFSATKLIWLYRNDEGVREAIRKGKAFFGTIDTWLLYRMTGGKSYASDYTNASRTMLFNLHTLQWDEELLDLFGLTGLRLPELKSSAAFFGETRLEGLLNEAVPVTGMIGDSHAAAFGEGCFEGGTAKATLGTGCSILMNIGDKPLPSSNGMVTTICWSIEDRVDYALEGVIVSCGATLEWLKNELQLFSDSWETEAMAGAIPDNGGVYVIPAFSGLGSPHWQMNRKASIEGLSFGATKNHIVRAALESIPYQVKDVIMAMETDAGISLQQLNTDGGISSNGFIMQFLSDLLEKTVSTIGIPDVSALGAAYMAGLGGGIFKDISSIKSLNASKRLYQPSEKRENVEGYYKGWLKYINND